MATTNSGRILIVNGWACGQLQLQPLLTELQDTTAAAIELINLPELGRLGGGYAQALASRLLEPRTLLVGWSTGALIALDALTELGAPPPNIIGLVAISATARFCSAPDYAPGTAPAQLRALQLGLRRQPRQALAKFFQDVYWPQPADAARTAAAVEQALVQDPDELRRGLQYLATTDLRSRVPAVGCPVLLLHGGQDRIIPAAAAQCLHRDLPSASVEVFADAGHALPTVAAAVVAKRIHQFYGTVQNRGNYVAAKR